MKKIKLTTTFARLKKEGACTGRYKHLAKSLGGITKYGRNTPINLLDIFKHNGTEDMLWSLRATKENCDKVARLMACDFAEEVLPIFKKARPKDKRPEEAIRIARLYAEDKATDKARAAAGAAAEAAAGAAARAAARAAAWAAAEAAAWAAARDAARAAAGAAAGAAAWAAAWDAAGAAAGDAAWAAAWDAAGAAAGKKQSQIIKRYLRY